MRRILRDGMRVPADPRSWRGEAAAAWHERVGMMDEGRVGRGLPASPSAEAEAAADVRRVAAETRR